MSTRRHASAKLFARHTTRVYWPTWVLTMVLAALLPITWGPFIGDYGRYIPSKAKASTCALAAGLGIFAGCWLAEIVAAFATTTFKDPTTDFATGFPAASPRLSRW